MEESIETVVSILEDDAFRSGGTINNDRLLLLAAKFQLTPEAIISVKTKLSERDVPFEMSDGEEYLREAPRDELDTGPDTGALARARDIIGDYFRESARYKLLTREEELALARRIHAGEAARTQLGAVSAEARTELGTLIDDGIDAREDLIQANLRLVPFVAKQIDTMGFIAQEDLIQEGNLGLLRAADKFDGEHGTRFSTYAYWWIWSFMMRAINDRSRLVRVPVHIVERIPTLLRAQRSLARERDGAPVLPQELADVLGWNLETVQFVLLAHASESVSLDAGTNDDAPTTGDRLTSPPEARPDAATARSQQRRLLRTLVDGLGERLAQVLTERFGLLDGIDRTLEEIGQKMGVTRERIRQLEAKALHKLRHPSRRRLLRDIFGLDKKATNDDTINDEVIREDSSDVGEGDDKR